jgi:hypothetical protein
MNERAGRGLFHGRGVSLKFALLVLLSLELSHLKSLSARFSQLLLHQPPPLGCF